MTCFFFLFSESDVNYMGNIASFIFPFIVSLIETKQRLCYIFSIFPRGTDRYLWSTVTMYVLSNSINWKNGRFLASFQNIPNYHSPCFISAKNTRPRMEYYCYIWADSVQISLIEFKSVYAGLCGMKYFPNLYTTT